MAGKIMATRTASRNSRGQRALFHFFAATVVATLGVAAPTFAQATAGALNWTAWSDPTENAFSVQAPQGWNVSGGLSRNGDSNFRQSVQAFLPENDLVVQIGDSALPPFVVPTPEMTKAGMAEGTMINASGGAKVFLLPYLPATRFNLWYASNRLQPLMDNYTVGYSHDEPALSKEFTAALQKVSSSPVSVSVGETSFTGRVKSTGQDAVCVVMSVVLHTGTPGKGDETWLARPILLGWDKNEQASASKATLGAVLTHLLATWQDSPQWIQQYDQAQASKPTAAKSGTSAGLRASTMGTYWKPVAARNESANAAIAFLQHLPDTPPAAQGSAASPFGTP